MGEVNECNHASAWAGNKRSDNGSAGGEMVGESSRNRSFLIETKWIR